MTEREKEILQEFERDYQMVSASTFFNTGAKSVMLNALRSAIIGMQGLPVPPAIRVDDRQAFMVGLTYEDIGHLHHGGTITVNPKDIGLVDMPIHIYLGGTHEHMEKGMAKHPGTTYKIVDSHKDTQN